VITAVYPERASPNAFEAVAYDEPFVWLTFIGPGVNRCSIVSLAARRKGIARSAVLHLDDARSAWGEVVIGSRRKAVLFRPDCGCRIAIEWWFHWDQSISSGYPQGHIQRLKV
jgi:hypothetical protein